MKIYISGLYSGPNPQPGVGIARSLRLAYPDATLVGVEYSVRSSGIHWPEFDELWIQRPWDELDLPTYGSRIEELLDSGSLWISGSDLESMWLAGLFPAGHKNLLTPPGDALSQITKPAVEAHKGLPVRIPTFISTDHPDWDLHAFCRKHDWNVWLKGPYYEAVRTVSWDAFEACRAALARTWATERLFLQAHVSGYEQSISLSAYRGELLGCVLMRKRELTVEGKTWAGDVTEVPDAFLLPLRKIIKDINWTGGAELEMVRDPEGQAWLLEWNPRFPAWIHGATIAGRNIPALLVEGATGIPARKASAVSEEFARVVVEVPVRPQFPLPPLPEPFVGAVGHSLKHPSGLPALAERLHKLNGDGGNRDQAQTATAKMLDALVPPSFLKDIAGFDLPQLRTPSWLFFESTAAAQFERAASAAAALSTASTQVTNAYSIKTNPDARLIKLALESGFLAEAISLLEVQKALEVGFKPEQVVLNGPGKWWPEGLLPNAPIHAVFCDSVADLKRVAGALERRELQAKIVGVRLRTPHIASRFGIPLGTPEQFAALVEAVALLPRENTFGVHFHMASSNIGVRQWWHLYDSMLRWCRSLEELTGRRIECLDVGGGWFPDDWHAQEDDRFAGAVAQAAAFLPHVRQIISEPGKAMAQPTMALAMRLLELQDCEDGVTDAVVDGSIAELPMYFYQPHRILGQDRASGAWQPLQRGKTRLLGRLCMEHDVVAWDLALPAGARAGDLLVFCDTGAYDRSMSYVFGQG